MRAVTYESSTTEKFKTQPSAAMLIVRVLRTPNELSLHIFLERVAAVTSAKYCDMIRNELRSAIRTKRRVKDYLRLLCDAELRALGDVINSLQLLYCKIIAQPIYCPDLTPSDYHLFGSLDSLLKSRCLRERSEENVGLVLLMCSPLIKITSYGSHCETCRPLG